MASGQTEQDKEGLRIQAALEMGQAQAQLFEIHRAMMNVSLPPDAQASLSAASDKLGEIINQISNAIASGSAPSPTLLMALEAAVGQAGTAAATAQASAGGGVASEAVMRASEDTRAEVMKLQNDLFGENSVFNQYMHFSSQKEEDEYKKRQAERQQYINRQPDMPQGHLNAGEASVAQMGDIYNHSEHTQEFMQQFMPRWNALVDKVQKQRAAMANDPKAVAEFDKKMTEDIRQFLKDKGLTEAQIDARLAPYSNPPNPLQAAKDFVRDDSDGRLLSKRIELNTFHPITSHLVALSPAKPVTMSEPQQSLDILPKTNLTDIQAKIRVEQQKSNSQMPNAAGVSAEADPDKTSNILPKLNIADIRAKIKARQEKEAAGKEKEDIAESASTSTDTSADVPLNGKPGEMTSRIDEAIKFSNFHAPDTNQATDGHGLALIQKSVNQVGRVI